MAHPDDTQTRLTESSQNINLAALAAYVLHLVGAITAIPSLIALVINYIKRHDDGPFADSHHSWMIRSFWWTILWCIIGWILTIILIGYIILGIAWLWFIYRHVLGLIRLLDNRPMPA